MLNRLHGGWQLMHRMDCEPAIYRSTHCRESCIPSWCSRHVYMHTLSLGPVTNKSQITEVSAAQPRWLAEAATPLPCPAAP